MESSIAAKSHELAENSSHSSQSFLSWIPFLWSRILFAGQNTEPSLKNRWALPLLLFVPGLIIYGSLSFPLFEPDEGRYAEIPREMLARGDWTVPYLQSEPYLDKPPLLYWLVMLSYKAFGQHYWSARLVPAIAIHGCILLTYLLGRRSLGEKPALWGALLLSCAPGLVSVGRLLVLDGLLTFWVTLAIFAVFEAVRGNRLGWHWWLLAAVATGLGILTKGPVALILVVPPMWIFRRLAGASCRLGWRAALAFGVVVLAVALPWYVAICCRLPGFAQYFLWQQNFVRFLAPFDHLKPIWFYGPVLMAGLLPGSLLVIGFIRFLISGRAEVSSRRPPELGYFVLMGGWCLFFFSMSGCKLPTYIMPAFPMLALAIAYYIVVSELHRTAWTRTILASSLLFVCLGHNVALPWYANYRAPLARIAELKDICDDPNTPVVCFPRNCDSIAFYVERDDFTVFRSKQSHLLVHYMQQRPRTVLLLTHRHSLDALRHALTPDLHVVEERHLGLAKISGFSELLMQSITSLMGETSLGLCDVAVIERRP